MAKDPVVAFAEIINENGIIQAWMSGYLDHLPDWMFTETPYNANPQLGRYLEITTDTFNKDNCVERISGYIVPEETGIYDFTGSCDDDYKLWISSDEWVENLSEEAISWENGWNSSGVGNALSSGRI